MLGIKKIDLITDKVADFRFHDLKYMLDVKYSTEIHTVALYDVHNYSTLVVNFVLIPKHNSRKYKVTIHFKKLGSFHLFAGGTIIQLSEFEILDISDRGWDSLKYLVRDLEKEDEFKFYCNDIEVVSIEEVDFLIS